MFAKVVKVKVSQKKKNWVMIGWAQNDKKSIQGIFFVKMPCGWFGGLENIVFKRQVWVTAIVFVTIVIRIPFSEVLDDHGIVNSATEREATWPAPSYSSKKSGNRCNSLVPTNQIMIILWSFSKGKGKLHTMIFNENKRSPKVHHSLHLSSVIEDVGKF